MEIAAHRVAHVVLEVGAPSRSRFGGRELPWGHGSSDSASELDPVHQHVDVARVREEPVLDGQRVERIRRSEPSS
jgi:hypothetical protein